ncbi:MAG TPA: SUMF1/EgtB/PvdO family nonheme iron enzyme [Candidatus Eremiobacteraeota bacterium]|nr:SUMF1/EgtB/PvdO family nonheme iron enzyme [Candidatus Eremiobacteraeota bacterium]
MSVLCSKCSQENEDSLITCTVCGSKLRPEHEPVQAGVILEGRYKIISLIKAGGMGAVYKALDMKLYRFWAIKELLHTYGTEEEQERARNWFNREAKILSRLDHSNLPVVSDYFINNNKYYIVMSFIEGEDLKKILKREGNPGLPQSKVLLWAKEILQLLDYLHSENPPIIYRDLKPDNIMLHKDGRVMLVDFGIARIINEADSTEKTIIGTNGYAPLEQCQGKVEKRSDIYALGATIHHLLTGIVPIPFRFEPLRKVITSVSPELEEAVMKSLQENPDERFQSAKEMLQALEGIKIKSEEREIKIDSSSPDIDTENSKKIGQTFFLNPDLILIPRGVFFMGNNNYPEERPIHKVQVNPFYMNKHPVTNKEFCKFLNSQGNQNEGGSSWINISVNQYCGIVKSFWGFKVKGGYENRPVVNVTWYGAVAYCNWLSLEDSLILCYGSKDNRGSEPSLWRKKFGYRLPTEAEWVYACRGNTETMYYWGDEMNDDYCWYTLNSKGNHHDVGLKKPNPFGLFDIIGNVWEWCSDWYSSYPDDTVANPSGPLAGTTKIIRGGSWNSKASDCKTTKRDSSLPDSCNIFLGFRIVKTR